MKSGAPKNGPYEDLTPPQLIAKLGTLAPFDEGQALDMLIELHMAQQATVPASTLQRMCYRILGSPTAAVLRAAMVQRLMLPKWKKIGQEAAATTLLEGQDGTLFEGKGRSKPH
jgi:hypothetical protein